MKTEFEFRSFMSRKELRQACALTREAAERLAPRMSPGDLDAIEAHGLALAAMAAAARNRWRAPPPDAAICPNQTWDQGFTQVEWQPLPHFITRSAQGANNNA